MDNIEYSGVVKIELIRNGKVYNTFNVHNEGTQLLFEGIASALVQVLNKDRLPNYIGIGTGSSNTTAFALVNEVLRVPISGRRVEVNKDSVDSEDGYKAIFKVTIPSTSLSVIAIKEIGLFGTSSGNSMLARIELEGAGIEIESGFSLSIEWTTLVRNKK